MNKRQEFNNALKEAMKSKDIIAVSTLRLILAALKDRDVALRSEGRSDGVSENEILSMLQTMIKQRGESAQTYRKAGREDLAEREDEEVKVIRRFLPEPLEEGELTAVVAALIEETNTQTIKDMGKVMGLLKERYAGRVDMAKAGGLVREQLK